MLAPVKQTMPAISMEYQRALGRTMTAGAGEGGVQVSRGGGVLGEGENDAKKGTRMDM